MPGHSSAAQPGKAPDYGGAGWPAEGIPVSGEDSRRLSAGRESPCGNAEVAAGSAHDHARRRGPQAPAQEPETMTPPIAAVHAAPPPRTTATLGTLLWSSLINKSTANNGAFFFAKNIFYQGLLFFFFRVNLSANATTVAFLRRNHGRESR